MQFGSDTIGKWFATESGIAFTVTAIEPYPADQVKKQFRSILDLPRDCLVSVNHRGTLILNITLDGGVVCLTKVMINGKVLDSSKKISEALGITDAYKGLPGHHNRCMRPLPREDDSRGELFLYVSQDFKGLRLTVLLL